MTCYAIQRPDGSIIVDTTDKDERNAWVSCAHVEGYDLFPVTSLNERLGSRGYKCVRVTVEEG